MNGADVVAAVRDAREEELDALAEPTALEAAAGTLDPEPVVRAAATAEARARDTFARWAAGESNATARHAFDAIAGTERDHYERIASHLEDPPEEPPLDDVHSYLGELSDPAARVGGGVLARELVAAKQFGQASTVLRDAGDEEAAALFEELHRGVEAITERSARLLDSVCADESDYGQAREAAIEVVAVAHDEYVDG